MKNETAPDSMPDSMPSSALNLFAHNGETLPVNLDVLISSRMLIQANSGGGKSRALRYILEQTFGHVQQIVLDTEGEFASLREKFDYLLAGQDGDVPATTQTAGVLCQRVMELGVSTVVDLYDLGLDDRRCFVRNFLEELVTLPRELWRPLLVVIDEAHLYCPQGGDVESSEAVKALITLGRKRGYCAIIATQRIQKFHKDAAAELLNKLIGRTGLDVDVKRAGDELGFDVKQRSSLKHLDPGRFYVYGPAISREVVLIQTGDVTTSHPEPGKIAPPPPPAPEKIRALVGEFQDMAEEVAQEERQTAQHEEHIAALEEQVLEMKQALESGGGAASAEEWKKAQEELSILRARDRDAEIIIRVQQKKMLDWERKFAALAEEIHKDVQKYAISFTPSPLDESETHVSLHNDSLSSVIETPVPPAAANVAPAPKPKPRSSVAVEKIPEPFQRVLDALATYESFGQSEVERIAVAALAGYRAGGHFNNTLGQMNKQAFIHYPAGGILALTHKGRDYANGREFRSVSEVHAAWFELCNGPQERVLRALVESYPQALTRDELSEICEMRGGHFNNTIGSLKTLGAIEYPGRGAVAASRLLFPEALQRQ